jgi:hypothetical protein
MNNNRPARSTGSEEGICSRQYGSPRLGRIPWPEDLQSARMWRSSAADMNVSPCWSARYMTSCGCCGVLASSLLCIYSIYHACWWTSVSSCRLILVQNYEVTLDLYSVHISRTANSRVRSMCLITESMQASFAGAFQTYWLQSRASHSTQLVCPAS